MFSAFEKSTAVKAVAFLCIFNLIHPMPGYSTRPVTTTNAPVIFDDLTSSLTEAGAVRSESRQNQQDIRYEFAVPAGQHKDHFTNAFHTYHIGNLFDNPVDIIPDDVVNAVRKRLEEHAANKRIKGFFVQDFGADTLVINVSHNYGQKNAAVHRVGLDAFLAGLRKAHELGLISADPDNMTLDEIISKTGVQGGEDPKVERGAESVGISGFIGAGVGAANIKAYHQYAVTHSTPLMTLTGAKAPGFRFRVKRTDDIEAGDFDGDEWDFEVSNDILEDRVDDDGIDVVSYQGRNETLPLLLLTGMPHRYQLTTVYPIEGSALTDPSGKSPQSTEFPILSVIYQPAHPAEETHASDPFMIHRLQSGGDAVGTGGSLTHFVNVVPGGEDNEHFVVTMPASLEQARKAPPKGFAWSVYFGYQSFNAGEIPGVVDHLALNPQAYQYFQRTANFLGEYLSKNDAQPYLSPVAAQKRVAPVRKQQTPFFIPAPKETELDPALASVEERIRNGELVTWTEDKADMEGEWGHTYTSPEIIAIYRAGLIEAEEKGQITHGNTLGYTTHHDAGGNILRVGDNEIGGVGDDGHLIMLGDKSPAGVDAHKLSFLNFTRAYLFATVYGRKWYGTGQDFQGFDAKKAKENPYFYSELSDRFFELLRQTMPLKALKTGIVDELERRWRKWRDEGVSQDKLLDPFNGNVSEQGMGSSRYAFDPKTEQTVDILAGDKMGPAAKNEIMKHMVRNAQKAGIFESGLAVEIWDVKAFDEEGLVPAHMIPQSAEDLKKLHFAKDQQTDRDWVLNEVYASGAVREDLSPDEVERLRRVLTAAHFVPTERIFLDAEADEAAIGAYLDDSDRFNVKHVWLKKGKEFDKANPFPHLDRPLTASSVTRLGIVAGGEYVGKDDPVTVGHSKLLHFAHEFIKDNPVIIQGDRNGSHWEDAIPTEQKHAVATSNSHPILVGLRYQLGDGGKNLVGVTDLYAGSGDETKPNEWDKRRTMGFDFNALFDLATLDQFQPHLTSVETVEGTYDLKVQHDRYTRSSSPYLVRNKKIRQPGRSYPEPVANSLGELFTAATSDRAGTALTTQGTVGRLDFNAPSTTEQRSETRTQAAGVDVLAEVVTIEAPALQADLAAAVQQAVFALNAAFKSEPGLASTIANATGVFSAPGEGVLLDSNFLFGAKGLGEQSHVVLASAFRDLNPDVPVVALVTAPSEGASHAEARAFEAQVGMLNEVNLALGEQGQKPLIIAGSVAQARAELRAQGAGKLKAIISPYSPAGLASALRQQAMDVLVLARSKFEAMLAQSSVLQNLAATFAQIYQTAKSA